MVIDNLYRTVAELSLLNVQNLDTLRFFEPPWGGVMDNVRCSYWVHWKARSGLLISDLIIELFSLAEALGAKIDRKWAISLQRSQFYDPKFQVNGDVPTNNFCMDS